MGLEQYVVDAAECGDVDTVESWLQSLERPEDINEVDNEGSCPSPPFGAFAYLFNELDEDPIRPVYFPIAAPDEILD